MVAATVRIMKKLLTLILLTICISRLYGQANKYVGRVIDSTDANGLAGVQILVAATGPVYSDAHGYFSFFSTAVAPFTLRIYLEGYESLEVAVGSADSLFIHLKRANAFLQEVVVSGARRKELVLGAASSIEKLSAKTIGQSATPGFFEALQYLPGVEMVASSLTFRQVNTRGFNGMPNQRFLQLVDGMDNQPPGLNFPLGNLFGTSNLDIEDVEVVRGTASALYGPVAFNGLLSMTTKSPFQYQGLSINIVSGLTHLNDATTGVRPMSDVSLRYASQIGRRFAFKVNASYLRGTDWLANNFTDVDAMATPQQRGDDNPARNALNLYGDEVWRALPGIGRVSRTGYQEKDLTTDKVSNLKLAVNLRYRLSSNIELSYEFATGAGTAVQTGSSRVMLDGFRLDRHSIGIKGRQYSLKAYTVSEDAGHSYDTRRLAQAINRSWVRDLQGKLVAPGQADNTWFQRYQAAWDGTIVGVGKQDHGQARSYADSGRFLPGSFDFEQSKAAVVQTPAPGGAAVISHSRFYHVDGQYELTLGKHWRLLTGGNIRYYKMASGGTLYDDLNRKVTIGETGVFIQAVEQLFKNRLSLVFTVRYDKNENFPGRFSPKVAGVYEVKKAQYLRIGWQTGFRNPVPAEQFLKNNLGAVTILGGAPANSRGMNVYENSFTASSVTGFTRSVNEAVAAGASLDQAIETGKAQLRKAAVEYVRPESVMTFEIGYRGALSEQLSVQADYYYSTFKDFILNTQVVRPVSTITVQEGISTSSARNILDGHIQNFVLFTNEPQRVSTQGVTMAATYSPGRQYSISVNGTWSFFDIKKASPASIPAFNTPAYRTSVAISNPSLTKHIGFSVNWRWQSAFDWISTLGSNLAGNIAANNVFDGMVSYKLASTGVQFKLGANNIFNRYTYQAYGAPSVGGLYYVSFLADVPHLKMQKRS